MSCTLQTSYFCGYACAKNLLRGPDFRSRPHGNLFVQIGRHVPIVHRRCADGRRHGSGMRFVSVASLDDLRHLERFRGGILVLKHSPRCSISQAAHHRVQKWMESQSAGQVGLINVLTERELSRQLAGDWSVEHESPQVLWQNADGSVHHTSHFGITAEWLNSLN